jgi:hypothetical protein
VLSEDEKARIRHEMFLREDIHRELARTKQAEKRYGVHPFLNSPFFLTAVCGILASVISHYYVSSRAAIERKEAREKAFREKQIALLSSVANDVPTYVSTMGSMRKFKLWLKEHPKSDDTYGDTGWSRNEVSSLYKEYFRLYLQARKASSILAEVRAYYDTPQVLTLANQEDSVVDAIEEGTKMADEVNKAARAQDEVLKALIKAMVEEIRPTPARPDRAIRHPPSSSM